MDQPYLRIVELPEVSTARILGRAFRWGTALLGLALVLVWDRIRRRRDIHRTAFHVRRMFERIGGTAVKFGQQLAVRVDLLPFEICQELGRLLDSVPPFDVSYAIERIEAVTGRPVTELFDQLHPEPIGSASVACVFQGRLPSGERVAVKVRRPGVDKQFMADIRAVHAVTRLFELTTLVRPDFFKYFRTELFEMFVEELDFRKEATFQVLFGRWARRDRIDWLHVPRVYSELSGADIITTSFEEGIPCAEVLEPVETNDEEALLALEAQEIDPKVLADRIMHLSFWGRQERPFFHADPHPGNILVRPGNHIVLLDFGACGVISRQNVEHSTEMMRRMVKDDPTGVGDALMGTLTPFPYIDLADLQHRLHHAMFRFYIGAWTKDAPWYERTSASLWLSMVDVMREVDVPINLEVLRFLRSTLLYDTLACRLDPSIQVSAIQERWFRAAEKRARRQSRKWIQRLTPSRVENMRAAASANFNDLIAKAGYRLGSAVRDLPIDNVALMGKGAFLVEGALRFVMSAVWFGTLFVGAVALYSWVTYGKATLPVIALWTLTYPVYSGGVLILFVLLVRRVLFRLSDKDGK